MHGRARYHLAIAATDPHDRERAIERLLAPACAMAARQGVFGEIVLERPPCDEMLRLDGMPTAAVRALREKSDAYLQHTADWFDFADGVQVHEHAVTVLCDSWLGQPPGSLVLRVITNLGVLYHVRNDVIVSTHTGHVFHLLPPRGAQPANSIGVADASQLAAALQLSTEADALIDAALAPASRRHRRRPRRKVVTMATGHDDAVRPAMPPAMPDAPALPAPMSTGRLSDWCLELSGWLWRATQTLATAATGGKTVQVRRLRAQMGVGLGIALECLQTHLHRERVGLAERLGCIGPVQQLAYAAPGAGGKLRHRVVGYGFRDSAATASWTCQRLSRSTKARDSVRIEALADHAHYLAEVRDQYLTGAGGHRDESGQGETRALIRLLKTWQSVQCRLAKDPAAQDRRCSASHAAFPVTGDLPILVPRLENGAMLNSWASFVSANAAEVTAGVLREGHPVVRSLGGANGGRLEFDTHASEGTRHMLRLRCIGFADLQFLRVRLLGSGLTPLAECVIPIPDTRHTGSVNGRKRRWLTDGVVQCFDHVPGVKRIVLEGVGEHPCVDIVSLEWIALHCRD